MNLSITISGKIVFSLLLISLCTICLSAQTTFSGLGSTNTGGAGFKTVTANSNIFVSNNMTQDGNSIFLDVNGIGATTSLTIKAEGTSTKIFTFTDMTIVGFTPATVANDSQIEFKDINGTPLQTMTLTSNKVLTNANTTVTSFFDNNTSTPINNVAEIEFTFHSTDSSPNDLTLVDITLSDYALPVELTSFEGFATEDGVVLNWQTATEVNNYGFNIERCHSEECSDEESNWEQIGFVQGYGTTNSPKNYEFTDSELPNADEVSYRLKQIDNDGTFAYSKVVTVDLTTITSVENELPLEYSLLQNYPNPFNPSTTIKFGLPEAGNAKLVVYNMLGQEVTQLLNKELQAGYHEINFDASELPSGMYIYKINANNEYSSIKKMILLK